MVRGECAKNKMENKRTAGGEEERGYDKQEAELEDEEEEEGRDDGVTEEKKFVLTGHWSWAGGCRAP